MILKQLLTRLLAEHEALDIGEAEAIALTVELKADLLLIDDGVGRRIAKERGLVITESLGFAAGSQGAIDHFSRAASTGRSHHCSGFLCCTVPLQLYLSIGE